MDSLQNEADTHATEDHDIADQDPSLHNQEDDEVISSPPSSASPPPLPLPQTHDRKRVKVYELRNNDWHDRGTGFCAGIWSNDQGRIFVHSEEEPDRVLLETRIGRDDGYQKQQDTLIVWTEPSGTDMALSFQEAEGCAVTWEFINEVQRRLAAMQGQDDALSDDVFEPFNPMLLPSPDLSNLHEVEGMMRAANSSPPGRDALAKFIMNKEVGYMGKLLPLVEEAEKAESLISLHRLCNVMKILILLNDSAIIEYVVTDEAILGVVGALEYDPDFPAHKANHRQYLADQSKFKEVVKIEDEDIKQKIHYTYRLQYLKDVVLARILDDPTFSVLNSLIFFHQVDIVQHLQSSDAFLQELFGIFTDDESPAQRKKDAIGFIMQCCSVAKNLQAQARSQLFHNFIHYGLFTVITYALRQPDTSMRVAGTEVLVALIDHDAIMMRSQIIRSMNDNGRPLTDTVIDLLLVEVDLGVKSQMADAVKVLLDPNANTASIEAMGRTNAEYLAKVRGSQSTVPQTENFIQNFYEGPAKKLFMPLKEIEHKNLNHLTLQEVALYTHLVDILCFFVRQHSFRSKYFILSEGLALRIAQLLSCPEKHLKLMALKYFRTCVGLQDEFHTRQLIQNHLFEPILNIVYETMPRDNMLNSACLELFEFIKRENMKAIILHLVDEYRERLETITYVPTFEGIILRFDQNHGNAPPDSSVETQSAHFSDMGVRESTEHGQHLLNMYGAMNGGHRWQGLKEADPEEEAYFNSEEDADQEEEDDLTLPGDLDVDAAAHMKSQPVKPLVAYPDDDEDDAMDDLLASSSHGPGPVITAGESDAALSPEATGSSSPYEQASSSPDPSTAQPLEVPEATPETSFPQDVTMTTTASGEKRRRDALDDGEEQLTPKRRSSSASLASLHASHANSTTTNNATTKRTTRQLSHSGPITRREAAAAHADAVQPPEVDEETTAAADEAAPHTDMPDIDEAAAEADEDSTATQEHNEESHGKGNGHHILRRKRLSNLKDDTATATDKDKSKISISLGASSGGGSEGGTSTGKRK